MNLKLVLLASIGIALVVVPLVAAAPLLEQNRVQNGDMLQIRDQQQLQTGDCTTIGGCDANTVGVAIQEENCNQ